MELLEYDREKDTVTLRANAEDRRFMLDVVKASWKFDPVARNVDETDLARLQKILEQWQTSPTITMTRIQFLDVFSIFIAGVSAEHMQQNYGIPDEKVKNFRNEKLVNIIEILRQYRQNKE